MAIGALNRNMNAHVNIIPISNVCELLLKSAEDSHKLFTTPTKSSFTFQHLFPPLTIFASSKSIGDAQMEKNIGNHHLPSLTWRRPKSSSSKQHDVPISRWFDLSDTDWAVLPLLGSECYDQHWTSLNMYSRTLMLIDKNIIYRYWNRVKKSQNIFGSKICYGWTDGPFRFFDPRNIFTKHGFHLFPRKICSRKAIKRCHHIILFQISAWDFWESEKLEEISHRRGIISPALIILVGSSFMSGLKIYYAKNASLYLSK